MGLFNFSTPQARSFNHKPLYYDPAKEEREERERRIKAELGLLDGDYTTTGIESRVKGAMRRGTPGLFEYRQKAVRKSNRRLLVWIILLAAITFFMIKL